MEHFHLVARVEAGGIAVEGVVVQIKSLISMSGIVIQVTFRHVQRIRRQIAAAAQFFHYAARLVIVSESIFIYGILVDNTVRQHISLRFGKRGRKAASPEH